MREMKSMGVLALAAMATAGAAAVPTVSNVKVGEIRGKYADITYSLSEPAVITLDVQTNCTESGEWVSVGADCLQTFSADSDVWKKVEKTEGKIRWKVREDFNERLIADGGIRAVVTAWPLNDTPDYMVVDISSTAKPNTQRYYPAAGFLPGGLLANKDYRKTKLVMKKVKAKNVTWTMGSVTERNPGANEAVHCVTLSSNYYLGVFPMTQAQSKDFYTAPLFTHPNGEGMRPEDRVCYNVLFAGKNDGTLDVNYMWPSNPAPNSSLGRLNARTGLDFTLPTEAEWEFACRAGNGENRWGNGTVQNYGSGYKDTNLDGLGRYRYNGGYKGDGWSISPASAADCATWDIENGPAVVGSYDPNDWGFYDMNGSVLEWCLDWYEDDPGAFGGRVNVDPDDPAKTLSGAAGASRVMRGGTYALPASQCRAVWRTGMGPTAVYYNIANTYPRGYRVCCRAGLD